jgi:hypothetical protein
MAPLSPDPNRQPTPWEEAMNRARPIIPAVTEQVRSAASQEIRKALDIDATILRPSTTEELQVSATRLAARHQEHLIATAFVSVVLRLHKDPNDALARAELQLIRDKANESGFFIMNYTPEMMMERLQSPDYIIAEASGRHYLEGHPNALHSVPSADCQIWLPEAAEHPRESLILPESTDFHMEEGLINKCKNRPWAFAEVKDISTSLSMNNTGLAGAARRCGFNYIRDVINPARGEFPIEYVGAEIGMLKGIVLPDGAEVRLENLGESEHLKNKRSMAIHFVHPTETAEQAWILKNRIVSVEFEGEQYGILTNWLMGIHKLKKSA